MLCVIFVFFFLLMIILIFFPETVNNFLYSRIPPECRPDPNGLVPAASIAALATGVFFFDALHRASPQQFIGHADPVVVGSRYIGGIFLGILGYFSCSKPAASLRRLIPQMHALPIASIEANPSLIRFAKGIGVVELVGAAYCLFRIVG